MKRTTIWAGLVLATAITLTACSAPVTEKPAPVAEASDTTEESPAPPPAEETKAAEQGTHANPFPKGTQVGTDEVTIALGEVIWNANDAVATANQFNEPPADGSTYALLPVTLTNVSSPEAVNPSFAMTIKFVADDGRTFDEAYQVIPTPLSDAGELYAGGVAQGNILFLLPNEVSAGGQWSVEETFSFGEPVFISAH